MTDRNGTQAFAATFVDELARCGLRAVCIAPGSRSAPLAIAFARHPAIRVWMHLDERSGSFFALGMAKATERPVALLCTSGTAAAEFHAAVIEAHHSRTPLLVLTADRPPELRDVGANQAIDQAHLYGSAVRWCFDPGVPDGEPGAPARWRRLAARSLAEAAGPPAGPVHLNLPFRDPLTPRPGEEPAPAPAAGPPTRVRRPAQAPAGAVVAGLAAALRGATRPLVIAGEMRDGAALGAPLDALLSRLDAPLLAEPASQLRRRGGAGVVEAYDALLRDDAWAGAHRPDLVLRLGAPPTSKVVNGFVARSAAPLIVVDGDGWRDPDQLAAELVRGDPALLLAALAEQVGAGEPHDWQRSWVEAGARAAEALGSRLAAPPLHEGHVVRALAEALPPEAQVVIGSSMPIRDADTFWPAAEQGQRFLGNRGASGIDGLVSTGLGAAAARPGVPTVLLLGDLTLYHDMNGLWAARRHGLRATIVVLDNDGGGIFSFLPQAEHEDVFEELFGTPLGLRLEDVARLYGLAFREVREAAELPGALRAALTAEDVSMVSVRFERSGSVAGHRACWTAVSEALREQSRL
ncbi:MAG TPA: 2-succinyl-5-enolpyruvyl-6-hydroxy-3-cyclohexene-1-carboxylic-acid synthase [Candidatus Dormibacteraeota bacterium]